MGNPLSGYDADVWMAANPSVALGAPEAAGNTDSGAWILYKANTHWAWDKRVPIVVQTAPTVGGTYTTATDYVFQYAGGVIVFNTARTSGVNNFVRIQTGNFFNLTQLDDAHTWALSLKATAVDNTRFQTPGGWATRTATTKEGSGKIDTFRSDGRVTAELGAIVALQLYASKTLNYRWEALGWVTGVDPKGDVKGVEEQAMSFDVEADCYFRTV